MDAEREGTLTLSSPEPDPPQPADGEKGERAPSRESPLAAGTKVGEYVIERSIGSGGFGTVYEARQPVIEKRVAIKVLAAKYSVDPRAVERFVAEARVANEIGHPNILGVFSFGRLDDGRHYHVTDLIAGETLESLLRRRGRLALEEALPILEGVAAALEAAHASGVVHRDLKPANVLLVAQGDSWIPKVIDFGIAKLSLEEGAAQKTKSGALLGTPLYMSPEQSRGRGVDERSDVYSFGVVAYEMLTGRPPFDAEDAVDVLLQKTAQDPLPPSRVHEALPAAVDAVILSMLTRDPARRPRRPSEAVSKLRDAVAFSSGAAAQGRSRGRGLLPVVLLVALGALVALALLSRSTSPVASATPPRASDPVSHAPPATGGAREPVAAPDERPPGNAAPEATPAAAGSAKVPGAPPAAGASPSERVVAAPSTKRASGSPPRPVPVVTPKAKAGITQAPGPDDTEQPEW